MNNERNLISSFLGDKRLNLLNEDMKYKLNKSLLGNEILS